MRPFLSLSGVALTLLLSACVTVNVYFPASAAEKAADRIIEDVWGQQPPAGTPAAEEPQAMIRPQGTLVAVLDLLVPAAQAQQADIDISSPAIKKIEATMKARHNQLEQFYASGAVGLTNDGMVAVRDPKQVPLAERRTVNQLVAEENRDRKALYRAIAEANGHPEWESQIQNTFASRWIAKARKGWWYQAGGGWKQK
ncbi:MAG: YdbL family protein [Gammaproteobacteria bacterium]|nr:YdbL family protein [Gammaproteobacteria bacterium]